MKKRKEKGLHTRKALLIDLVQEVLLHCNVGTVITGRILEQFKVKVCRMENAMKKSKKWKAKETIKKQMDQWQHLLMEV